MTEYFIIKISKSNYFCTSSNGTVTTSATGGRTISIVVVIFVVAVLGVGVVVGGGEGTNQQRTVGRNDSTVNYDNSLLS